MSHVNEIIVLDDDEDEEEPPTPANATNSSCNSPKQANGKEEESSSSRPQSKAQVISAQNKELFNEFIEYCSKLTLEHPEVISFLQGRYAKANPPYLNSVEFRNTLGRCLTRVQAKRSKIFVYINELCTALKANSQKRKVSLQTQAIQAPAAEKLGTLEEDDDDGEGEESPVKKTGSKRQIRYLENLLRIYSLEIKKLQEKELTLEELGDEDSSYIQESRLKRKLLRIFEKLCDLKDCSSLTGRVIEQRILYRGTRYPEVNRRLEKFINSSRDLFPDYGDVLRVVERANDKHSLGLARKQMQSMAQDAFRELGNKLQDRRHLDMIYNFGCHLTDPYKSVNDPAQQDTSLTRRLRENRHTAMSHLDDIIKKYAQLQDDGEDEYRKKVAKKEPEKNRQSSSEEEEESEESDTDIEEELQQSKTMPDSEEGENEEEEITADQENEADQKMDMVSGGEDEGEKDKEDGDDETDNVMEEATEQESSPASTSSSHDKDSPNTTLESEVEARLSGGSPDLPSNDSPAKAKSDEEQEACVTATDVGDQGEENEEDGGSVQSSAADEDVKEIKEDENVLNCKENSEKHKSAQKYLLPDMRVSLEEKDEENAEQNDDDDAELAESAPCEGSDAGIDSETSRSPVVQEESCAIVDAEEPCVERRISTDSEAASLEEEPVCTDTAGNHDYDHDGDGDHDDDHDGDGNCDDDDHDRDGDRDDDHDQVSDVGHDDDDDEDPVDDAAASDDQRSSDSPVTEHPVAATKVHAEAADPDTCDDKMDCDSSPLGSSNGVHTATQVHSTPLNRLKLKKDKVTHRDSHKPRKTEEDSPTPYRKRKDPPSENWTEKNGLTRYNGKKTAEEQSESNRKRVKMDSSFSSLSSSSDYDSDLEDDETPGLMMTCSPRETPTKPTKKSHVFTQCDPDEVIVLSD